MSTVTYFPTVSGGGGSGTVTSVSAALPLIVTNPTTTPAFTYAQNDIITAGSDLTDLVIAPTVWTLNGDTDGDYIFEGNIITPAASTGVTYGIQPNADTTGANYQGVEWFGNSGTAITAASLAAVGTLTIGTGTTNAGNLIFTGRLQSKSGRIRQWTCWAVRCDATAPSYLKIDVTSEYLSTATVFGPTTRLHASTASTIKTGSIVRIQRLLNTT